MLQKHQSRPLWARELKLICDNFLRLSKLSRPLWARELKRKGDSAKWQDHVAPPVGA